MTEAASAVVSIRAGRPGDAAACAAIKIAWIDATPWMPRLHPPEDVARHYREVVFPARTVWVAGDPVAGFLALDAEAGEVTSLYVAERGRGIGRALLDRAKAGRDRLRLWTFAANAGARRFYAREGFARIDRTDGDNEEGLPDMLLEWTRAPEGPR